MTSPCVVFAIAATRKKLSSEDRTFQQAMQVAIASDEVAAKESIQVQQQLPQPVHSVVNDPPSSTSRRNSNDMPPV